MKPRVSIVRVDDDVEGGVEEAIDLLGGVERFARPGGVYLVKPNLFTTISAERGATTDPRIFMTLAELIREAGGRPVVGE